MKKYLVVQFFLILTLVFSNNTCEAQSELWGMTTYGGNGGGVIYKTDSNGEAIQVMHKFVKNPVQKPTSGLFRTSNNIFYGLATDGTYSTIFEFDPINNVFTKKTGFSGACYGWLMKATNGKLYGTTQYGGTNSWGSIFEYNPINDSLLTKYSFAYDSNGYGPLGSLIQASNGKFYGATYQGGLLNFGTIFEYDITTDSCKKLVDFDKINTGMGPRTLIQAMNGDIYGLAREGGTGVNHGNGTLFKYDISARVFTKLFDFDSINGNYPSGSLFQASNGKLYGLTNNGGTYNDGIMFEYNPVSDSFAKIMDFEPTSNGANPDGNSLTEYNGKLYGTWMQGGLYNRGVIFDYDLNTGIFTKRFNFQGSPNSNGPEGTLIIDSIGNLYGTTWTGGNSNYGTLYKFNIDSNLYTKMIDFWDNTAGQNPQGSLLYAPNKMFYGMTTYGGTKNKGVLFKYDPAHNVFEKKVDFIGSNGQEPYGSLTACSNWKLYGMTRNGGNDNYGILFEYDPFNDTLIKKVDFADSIGILSEGSLLEASNGKLYGMTNIGGTHDGGVLFEYNPITSSYAKKIDFTGATNGRYPEGTLIQAKNGLLYGTTAQGGIYDNGVLFEYDPVTNNLVKKIDFDGTNIGSLPYGALFQADDGKLYGMTSYGGVYDSGVLFNYDIASGVLTKLLDYNGDSTGYRPRGTLMQAVNGKLYGTTCCGGIWSGGTLFEYDIQTNKFVKKEDFNQINGYTPTWGQLVEIGGMVGIPPIIPPENEQGIAVYPNPSNGRFTVSLKDNEAIRIYNTMGMEIYNGQYQKGENNLVLDLPNGIYILKAWNGKTSSSVKISVFN